LIQQNLNPRLRLTGIVLTMYDRRTKLSEQVVAEVRRYFGPRVYDTIIPRTVRLSEAPGYGRPITAYDSSSKGAKAYRRLAREFLAREATDEPLPDTEPPGVMSVERSANEEGGEEP
jgi:chromosome partitioning protein